MVECIMDKLILVIGGGIESIPGILIAKKNGYKVLVSDLNPNAPSFEFADFNIISSTYDHKQTAKKLNFSKIFIKFMGLYPYLLMFLIQ